jgi:sugar phosphate isomerase/epimerase
MRIEGRSELGHLTYCTNIHAGEPLDEVMASLARHLPVIRSRLAGDQPMGVGLRLGHAAVAALADTERLAELARFLAEGNYYVFTVNGFPYGAFHGQTVKEGAYRPDWADPLRLAYTTQLADILAHLLPAGQSGSLSTVPCTFKPWAEGRLAAFTDQLIRQVAYLCRLASERGKVITLALEPEPFCYLETIEETVAYFNTCLFSRAATLRLAALTGLSASSAQDAMHRHIGVCYDVCHAAVEFEDPRASIARLRENGIAIAKVQLSSAMRIAHLDGDSLRQLEAFAEPVYLHQVVARTGGVLKRYEDLPQAIAAAGRAKAAGSLGDTEWRVHFHVPIFLPEMKDFGTTQSFLLDILDLHRVDPISQHLEVETYTWDVLPPAYHDVDLSTAIARELDWVRQRLAA